MSHFHQTNKFNYSGCNHCSDKFKELQYYNQPLQGTVNSPKIGQFVRSAYGGVGFPSATNAYQNDGGYATLKQAYPGYYNLNPKNASSLSCDSNCQ